MSVESIEIPKAAWATEVTTDAGELFFARRADRVIHVRDADGREYDLPVTLSQSTNVVLSDDSPVFVLVEVTTEQPVILLSDFDEVPIDSARLLVEAMSELIAAYDASR